ncbi:uncharacterized protein LOC131013194 [Salvia miltiorrhiza]|uniref:uncharacterized protein LOC131013194 n=1 Tax=Salvia miltiorrhiza TaxID=226208 RepID=UPI0025AD5DF1|nr:uncharacterized protein LOC131013194 [Salvia miltiorrhiza]
MEQNTASIAKKIWKIVRVVYFMLRKGISKGKLLADLNMMMKRGKIASKAALHNILFHHHGASRRFHDRHVSTFPASLNDYEFSCSDTPTFRLPFHLNKRKTSHAPPFDSDAMAAALEMFSSAAASPALPGFGPSPLVRQLRITDSPFPLREAEEDNHVDEAAEEFITKFHNDLKRQNSKIFLDYY